MATPRRVAGWTMSFVLAWPLVGAAQFPSSEDVSGVPCPPAKPSVSAAGRPVATEREYVALVSREQLKALSDMSAEGARTIDRAVRASAQKSDGAELGLIFLSINDVSAAIYAITISATRDPADAITANNLGAAFKVARAYESALAVLLYADALQPDSPIILTNLGNVAFALGDGETAGRHYRAALDALPDHPPALTGLGSLALCQGDKDGAERYFHKALSDMYLPAARAGLSEARSTSADEPGEAGDPEPGAAGAHQGASQPSFTPIEHPAGKGGGQGISLPDPPISPSARETGRRLDDFGQLVEDGQTQILDLGEQIQTATTSMSFAAMAGASASSGGGLVLSNPYDKEAFVLDDLWRLFDGRISARSERLVSKVIEAIDQGQVRLETINERMGAEMAACTDDPCFRAAELKACRAREGLATQVHGQFLPIWQELWQGTHQDLSDYQAFSTPWLQDVHDVSANRFYNITRQMYILGQASSQYALSQSEAGLMAQLTYEDCTIWETKTEPWVPRPLKAWPDDPMKCRTPTLHISVVFAKVEGDCDKFKVEFAAGVFASGEYRWGKTSSEDQVTLWGGVGVNVGAGGVSAGGKIGPYVTYQVGGDSTKMVDYGVKDEASVSATLGPAAVEGKATARFSAETGVTVDYSVRGKLGGKIRE